MKDNINEKLFKVLLIGKIVTTVLSILISIIAVIVLSTHFIKTSQKAEEISASVSEAHSAAEENASIRKEIDAEFDAARREWLESQEEMTKRQSEILDTIQAMKEAAPK